MSKPKNIDSGSPLNQEFLRAVSMLPTYKAFLDEWERGGGGGWGEVNRKGNFYNFLLPLPAQFTDFKAFFTAMMTDFH